MKFLASIFLIILTLIFSAGAYASELEAPEMIKAPIGPAHYTSGYIEPTDGLIEGTFQERSYYIYIPPQLENSEAKRPLLLALHGAKRTGASMIDKWKSVADQNGFIVIAPTNPKGAWPLADSEVIYIKKLVQYALPKYNVDSTRVYAFGHSSGGIMTIALSAMTSDIFAATSLHAGSFDLGLLGSITSSMRANMPITFITGTMDKLFPIKKVRATAQIMHDAGANVKQYEVKWHNHWYYDNAEFLNALAWDSMQKHALPPN